MGLNKEKKTRDRLRERDRDRRRTDVSVAVRDEETRTHTNVRAFSWRRIALLLLFGAVLHIMIRTFAFDTNQSVLLKYLNEFHEKHIKSKPSAIDSSFESILNESVSADIQQHIDDNATVHGLKYTSGVYVNPHVLLIPFVLYGPSNQLYGIREAMALALRMQWTPVRVQIAGHVVNWKNESRDGANVPNVYNFGDLFDVELLNEYVHTVDVHEAHRRCGGRLRKVVVTDAALWEKKQWHVAEKFGTDVRFTWADDAVVLPPPLSSKDVRYESHLDSVLQRLHTIGRHLDADVLPELVEAYGLLKHAHERFAKNNRTGVHVEHAPEPAVCVGVGFIYENLFPRLTSSAGIGGALMDMPICDWPTARFPIQAAPDIRESAALFVNQTMEARRYVAWHFRPLEYSPDFDKYEAHEVRADDIVMMNAKTGLLLGAAVDCIITLLHLHVATALYIATPEPKQSLVDLFVKHPRAPANLRVFDYRDLPEAVRGWRQERQSAFEMELCVSSHLFVGAVSTTWAREVALRRCPRPFDGELRPSGDFDDNHNMTLHFQRSISYNVMSCPDVRKGIADYKQHPIDE